MADTTYLSVQDLETKIASIFRRCGVVEATAQAVARVIAAGERDGCKSHGLHRVGGCLQVLKAGKVVPDAEPRLCETAGAIVRVSAQGGFQPPAYEAGRDILIERARENGFAALVVNDCLHFSALWYEAEDLAANAGLAALSMCPSYATVAPHGGRKPLLGTNPLAFGWPGRGENPYVFDFATSIAARGEVELHRRAGQALPEGWAIDAEGEATTDPQEALDGALLPFGGHKGSALSTMIELMAGAMIGDFTSRDASAFMGGSTLLPRHGALILAFDPEAFVAGRDRDPLAEGDALLAAMGEQGARLPSMRRYAARAAAERDGVALTRDEIESLDRYEKEGLAAV